MTLTEFKALAAQKVPLVQVRGEWVELRQDQIASALEFFKKRQADGEMLFLRPSGTKRREWSAARWRRPHAQR